LKFDPHVIIAIDLVHWLKNAITRPIPMTTFELELGKKARRTRNSDMDNCEIREMGTLSKPCDAVHSNGEQTLPTNPSLTSIAIVYVLEWFTTKELAVTTDGLKIAVTKNSER
jgi:hypothetical protein